MARATLPLLLIMRRITRAISVHLARPVTKSSYCSQPRVHPSLFLASAHTPASKATIAHLPRVPQQTKALLANPVPTSPSYV